MEILGVDIGGSGIKGALVDIETGELKTERIRVPTPVPSTPNAIAQAVKELVESFKYTGPIGWISSPGNQWSNQNSCQY